MLNKCLITTHKIEWLLLKITMGPIITNQEIIKVKALNRTASGIQDTLI